MANILKNKTSVCCNILQKRIYFNRFTRTSSSGLPETIFIEKGIEQPVIVIDEQDDVDIIGPPDAVSNLRPIVRKHLTNATTLQKKLRHMQNVTQNWNQEFWSKHNIKFIEEKNKYINSRQVENQEKRQLTADEMSEFYKKFLDDNWHTHLKYNAEWYRRNFSLLWLSLCVCLEKYWIKYS